MNPAHDGDDRERPIAPDSFARPPLAEVLPSAPQAEGAKSKSRLVLVGTGVVGVLALLLAVLFWLPQTVSPPPVAEVTTETSPPPLETPWRDAQLARERRIAQEVLAGLIERQTQLEAMAVEAWAGDDYRAALRAAELGDVAYRQRQFDQAKARYREAGDSFSALIERSAMVFEARLADGVAALKRGEQALASTAFQQALAIRPDSEAAQLGLRRAEQLNRVLALIQQGEGHAAQQRLGEALASYRDALDLDPESELAAKKLAQVQAQSRQHDYTAAMSEGYRALEGQQYASARRAFERARGLLPESASGEAEQEVRQALAQVASERGQQILRQGLRRAAELEAAESWSEATAEYDKLVQLDQSVVAARVGQLRARSRAELDRQLQALVSQPLRLGDAAVHRQAQALEREARALPEPGPRLRAQTEQLQQLLKLADTPVVVHLRSDNQTHVVLHKVGVLGHFAQRELNLKPGEYTLVGQRDGFRDVRREFSIEPGAKAATIDIQCEEPIALGG